MKHLFWTIATIVLFLSCVEHEDLQDTTTVDLGLSVKWASVNVGASKPEEYGNFYAWGETATKELYNVDTFEHHTVADVYHTGRADVAGETGVSYNYVELGNICGTDFDAVRASMGEDWRLPTVDEYRELIENCTYTWTEVNGVKGAKFTSKINGNSIFFPDGGQKFRTYWFQEIVAIWTGTHSEQLGCSYILYCDPKVANVIESIRVNGFNVRGVCK